MTSCDSVSSNLGESKIRLNSFNESKLDLNQAFKPPKLTAKAPRSPSQRRRQEARGAAITSLILSPKSREPRKTRNTRKQGIREIRGQSSRFFHFGVYVAPLHLCTFAFNALEDRASSAMKSAGKIYVSQQLTSNNLAWTSAWESSASDGTIRSGWYLVKGSEVESIAEHRMRSPRP
jgi:hypothetical protein